jgi:hypothetical protein
MIQKTQATQAKINKYIKLGSSAWPRKQTEWRKNLENGRKYVQTYNKGLISKMYKEPKQLNSKGEND